MTLSGATKPLVIGQSGRNAIEGVHSVEMAEKAVAACRHVSQPSLDVASHFGKHRGEERFKAASEDQRQTADFRHGRDASAAFERGDAPLVDTE